MAIETMVKPAVLQVDIQNPIDGHKVKQNSKVTFEGTCGDDVRSLELWAEGAFKLGVAKIEDGKWKLDRKFTSSGLREIEAVAFNADGRAIASDRMRLHVAHPPVPSERKRLVSIATSQLGNSESPRGSNSGPNIAKYFEYCGHGQGVDWCFMFLNWIFHKGTGQNPPWGKSMAWVPSIVAWAKRHDRWIRENDPHRDGFVKGDPQPGDLLIMGDYEQMSARNNYPHIEMVIEVGPTSIKTIGGNVSQQVSTARHTRVGHDPGGRYIAGYVRTV